MWVVKDLRGSFCAQLLLQVLRLIPIKHLFEQDIEFQLLLLQNSLFLKPHEQRLISIVSAHKERHFKCPPPLELVERERSDIWETRQHNMIASSTTNGFDSFPGVST